MTPNSQEVLPWLNREIPAKVCVIGDLILDEYLDGKVIKISPEAPVPIIHVQSQSVSAGGAANTASNVKALGGSVDVLGVCGKDEGASSLLRILKRQGIGTSGIIEDPSKTTVRKCRVYSSNQQLMRIDWEKIDDIGLNHMQKMQDHLSQHSYDIVVMSDYAKGTLQQEFVKQVIEICRSKAIKVIIDPKGQDYSKYKGAFLITPNYKEACLALGEDEFSSPDGEDLAKKLKSRFEIENVLLTMGAEGMVYVDAKEQVVRASAEAKDVFDVTGAGDTVVAVMALCAANAQKGGDIKESLLLANLAAGKVVEKKGVYSVTSRQLEELFMKHSQGRKNSLKGQPIDRLGEVSEFRSKDDFQQILGLQKQKKKIVFTNGCFDLLHKGHLSYLSEAKKCGDILVVGLNSDESVRRLKGQQRPVNDLSSRAAMLRCLRQVDFVLPFSEDDPLKLILDLKPDVLVKGADWEIEHIVGAQEVQSWGGEVKRIHYLEGYASTSIIEKIKS